MSKKSIYIAATSQHVGKTTMTLGLLAALKSLKKDVGYCKPLGQQYLEVNGERVDKDAVLFADCMNFELEPKIHSPIILGPGDTADYIENPKPGLFIKKILKSADVLRDRHEMVVYEGTGHPGVGSVVDLSNAEAAQQLESEVILVLEGGIGNTLDRLSLCKAIFDQAGVKIVGVLINKVHSKKMEKVRHYLEIALKKWDIELLGIIPYDEVLVYPSMRHIVKAVKGKVLNGKGFLANIVSDTIAGINMEFAPGDDPSKLLLVVSYRRLDEALQNFEALCKERNLPLHMAGILVTGQGELTDAQVEHCIELSIPVVQTPFDTYDAVIKMDHLVAKIDTQNQQKIQRAIKLFKEHVNISRIVEIINAQED
ncbi:MAG: AAA family ATPase [Lentisphaeraceae bacterium]|nr:AAA family ATPase [Lentisphaeraceae bacterium]